MRARMFVGAALVTVMLTVASGSSASFAGQSVSAGTAAGSSSDVLRIGTINYIDSLNPYNYIEAQAYNAMMMIYPQLVQYGKGMKFEGDWASSWKTSADGKDWTFRLRPNTKWSDGEPMTASDAAWTINTTVKYAKSATAQAAAALAHVKNAQAVNPTTLVIHYESPVGNVLAQLEQVFILPQHVWQKLAGGGGKGLKTYHPELHLPMVTGGAYTLAQYEKKGTTGFMPDPNYYGPPSQAAGVALTYYTNADAMIADLKSNNLDWADQVPFKAVNAVKKSQNIVVTTIPSAETTNITWNSNPVKPKNRELLKPAVKKALSMCVDRDKIIDVVFAGYADKVESLLGKISARWRTRTSARSSTTAQPATRCSMRSDTSAAPTALRVAPATTGKYAQPAHPMQYEIMHPTSPDFNVDREFEIVKDRLCEAGVEGDAEGRRRHDRGLRDRDRRPLRPRDQPGYTGWDIAMWDWVGYIDPDFMLSVVTKGNGARGATPAGTTPTTTSSTSSRARRSTRRSARRSSSRWSR